MLHKDYPVALPDYILTQEEFSPENCLFFDIETTGLSWKTSHLYLLGAVFYENGTWIHRQWFCQKPIEEKDVLEDMRNKQKYKLEYKTIKNEISYSYNTRKENITINNLIKYIEKEKNNKEIIDYLYYEWFNKNNNEKDKYLKLIDSIKEKYSEKHDKLKKIVELINS